jgi:hypothetical protein
MSKAEATTVEAPAQVDLRAVWWHNEDHYTDKPKGCVYKLVHVLYSDGIGMSWTCSVFIPHSGRAKIRQFMCNVNNFELEVVEHFLAPL